VTTAPLATTPAAATPDATTVLRTEGLTKSYGGRPPALTDVTLEVHPGVTGLLGPNGAGKSTLIQCVLGLLRDFRGKASVLGLDARADRLEIRRRVGYMPESDSLLPRMTGVTSVRYLGQLTGMPRRHALRRAHECLHYVGLTEALYRPGEEYSTGMRQRLKLAQALVHDPEVLFLDEPVSGMDPSGRDEFLRLIRSLAKDHGKHVVWSSHMLPDVQRVADGVLVLDRGRVRGSFRLEALHGASGRWRIEAEGDEAAFSAAVAAGGGRVEARSGGGADDEAAGPSLDGRPRFERVVAHPVPDAAPPILAAARAAGLRVRALEPLVERLEDVFHRLLGDAPSAGPTAPAGDAR
jgi:ABC-2 type transport system ATP-binding protein